jgi:hypothetical protein
MVDTMSTQDERLAGLGAAMERDLRENVLPFWLNQVLDERRGFHGFVSDRGLVDPRAPMGAVLCARLLWTFSAAQRTFGEPEHRRAAEHFCDWLTGRFFDGEHGGVYWMLDADGRAIEDRKQTYAQAFGRRQGRPGLLRGAGPGLERARRREAERQGPERAQVDEHSPARDGGLRESPAGA